MIDQIITALKNTSSVTTFVPADNIFPLIRLQQSDLPAAVVQLVDTEPIDTKDDSFDLDVHTVEVTTIAEHPRTAWRASGQIRLRLQGYTDTYIIQTRFVTQATDVFEATEVHSVTQRYECHTKR